MPKSMGRSASRGMSVVSTAVLKRMPRKGLMALSPIRLCSPRPASTTRGTWSTWESRLEWARAEYPIRRIMSASTPTISAPRK